LGFVRLLRHEPRRIVHYSKLGGYQWDNRAKGNPLGRVLVWVSKQTRAEILERSIDDRQLD
jgi:hypothetical protein